MTEPARPRILILTRNLPPLVGGMERLNWHLAQQLALYAEVRVVGPTGAAALAPAGVLLREAPLKPLWKFLWRACVLGRREARCWKPHIVLAGSGLTAPLAQLVAHACGARVAVYVHGLDVATRHPVYRALWLPAIRRAARVIANSAATAQLCRGIGVDAARIGIVHPGVDLPVDADAPPTSRPDTPGHGSGDASMRARHALGEHPLLLSVGRLSERKGLREFVERALPRIVAKVPTAILLIVGDAPSDALNARAQTPDSIRATAARAGVAANLRFLGTITDYQELGGIYANADVHVFPVREILGDPEGFGMVAVEAAAHGLPTVAFATGGVADAVAEGKSGHLVAAGDYPAFADAVIAVLGQREHLREPCIAFARQFAWPVFGRQVAALLAEHR